MLAFSHSFNGASDVRVTAHPATILPVYIKKNSNRPLAYGKVKPVADSCQLDEIRIQPSAPFSELLRDIKVIQTQLSMIFSHFTLYAKASGLGGDLGRLLQEGKLFFCQNEGRSYVRLKVWPSQVDGDGLASDSEIHQFILLLAQTLYLTADARFHKSINYYSLYIPCDKLLALKKNAVQGEFEKSWFRAGSSESIIMIPFQFATDLLEDKQSIFTETVPQFTGDPDKNIYHCFPRSDTLAAYLYQRAFLEFFPNEKWLVSAAMQADPFLMPELKAFIAQHDHRVTVIRGLEEGMFKRFHRLTMQELVKQLSTPCASTDSEPYRPRTMSAP